MTCEEFGENPDRRGVPPLGGETSRKERMEGLRPHENDNRLGHKEEAARRAIPPGRQ